MSVLIETTVGDVVIDLLTDTAPNFCSSFLKLCKLRYYDKHLFFNVVPNRFAQVGDPSGTGGGGSSIHGVLDSAVTSPALSTSRFIADETPVPLSANIITSKGILLATKVGNTPHTNGSQFLVTTQSGPGNALSEYVVSFRDYTHFATVAEDYSDVLSALNGMYADEKGRPYTDVRIERTHVLHDPFPDPPELQDRLRDIEKRFLAADPPHGRDPNSSPLIERPSSEKLPIRISAKNDITANDEDDLSDAAKEALELEAKRKEAKSRAVVLEMLGDIHSADAKPPENVLFVCKLNPVTSDEDLELIFSRFDQNCKAEIQRDHATGDSLNYAFVEFDSKEACTEAYFKMNNALIDDRRIKVDFSQSVAKEWNRYSQKKLGGGQPAAHGANKGGGQQPAQRKGPIYLGGARKPNPATQSWEPPVKKVEQAQRKRELSPSPERRREKSSKHEKKEKKDKKKKTKKDKKHKHKKRKRDYSSSDSDSS